MTLWACGATTRARMRPSELTWGYSLPRWFEVAGFQSSAGALAVWAGPGGAASIETRASRAFRVFMESRGAWSSMA